MSSGDDSNHILTDYNFEINLKEIVCRLTEQKISILCGAGISYNSGLPIVYQFLDSIFTQFELSDNEKGILHRMEFPFEAFIEMLQKECETDELLKIFKDGQYNTNHLLIAHLIKNKLVKNIITTNFDELIEQACQYIGLVESVHYNVYRREDEFGSIDQNSDIPNLIKIHGCSSDHESMAINMKMVANQTDSENKNNVIREFFKEEINSDILILGYSCSDVFDLSPVIERIKDGQGRIVLIEHIVNLSDSRLEDLVNQRYKNPFLSCKDGIRLFLPTDLFIEKLWKVLELPQYCFIKHNSTNWRNNIDRWYDHVVISNTRAFKHHICSRLFYNIGYYDLSENHYHQGIAIAFELQEYKTAASEIGNLGMNYNALGRYNDAKTNLTTSLDLYRRTGDIEGEIIHLQNLGNVFRNEGNYPEAEMLIWSSVKLAEKEGTPSNVCKGMGNLALIYNLTREYKKAADCAEYGMKIANKYGIKQSESSQLATLAQAYFGMGNAEKAIEFYMKSIKITRQMKDRRNESGALINLGIVFREQGQFANSLECLSDALKIAIELGTIQNQGLAYFNMAQNYLFLSRPDLALNYCQKALIIFEDIYPPAHPHLSAAKGMIADLKIT